MKFILIILAVLLAVVPVLYTPIVLSDTITSDVAQTSSAHAIRLTSGHSTFYAEGRYWVFYVDTSDDLVYKTSTDGSSWSSAIKIADLSAGNGVHFDVVFDGTYLHYVRNTVATYENIAYRRGDPQSDGSISWSAAEQTALTGMAYDIALAVDSGGYIWVGYGTGVAYPTVIKSSTNDGTWNTASGFPYTFFSTAGWFALPVAQTLGKVYCLIYRTDFSEEIIKGYAWDGDSWESQQDATTSGLSNIHGSGYFGMLSAVNDGDDIHLVFMDASGDIQHVIRSLGTWGSEVEVEGTTLAAYSSPVLTKKGSGHLICYWLHSDDWSYHKVYYDGSWDASATRLTDETSDTFTAEYNVQAYYEEYGDKICLLYQTGASANYDIVHAIVNYLPKLETDACSDVQSTSFDANGDITISTGTVTTRGFHYSTIFDGFEWGSDGDPLSDDGGAIDWTISFTPAQGTSKVEIDTAQHYTGTRSARLYRDGTNRPVATFSQSHITSSQVLSLRVRKDETSDLLLYHGDGTHMIGVRIAADEDVMYHDNASWQDSGVDAAKDTWHILEIKNVNWVTESFDVYLDGILIGSATSLWDSAGSNNQVQVHNYAGTSEIWLDEVGVWDVEDESGSFGEGEYSLEITGLDPDTTYYVQAFAKNSVGFGYGDIVSQLTSPTPTGYSWGGIIG